MTGQNDVYSDLAAEGDALDVLVAGLDDEGWATPTPSPGWTIGNQIAHLAFISHLAVLSSTDPEAFEIEAAPSRVDFQGSVDAKLAEYMNDSREGVLSRWRTNREKGAKGLAAVPEGQMVPWLQTPLPPSVLAAAGIMEIFGHGQDVADALRVKRERTDRIVHLTYFGLLTRAFGYVAHGEEPPTEPVRLELVAPSGAKWNFGPEDSTEYVSGSAWDFCLLALRRRHRDDLDLTAHGAEASHWLDIAQAYRGPAGEGRRPGQFADLDR